MPLHRLDPSAIESAVRRLLQDCDEYTLEKALSSQDVYLECQPELANLHGASRLQRLAELSVYLLGDGLLRTALIRDKLCVAASIESPSSFRSGTSQAISICEALRLPDAFAGALPPLKPPPVSCLRQFRPIPKLLNFQEEVLKKALSSIKENRSCLLSLPTGGGKTLVGTTLQKLWHDKRAENSTSLWLAHTEELCEQASSCIEQVWQSSVADVGKGAIIRAWGPSVQKLLNGSVYLEGEEKYTSPSHSIIVSTPQSALRILKEKSIGSLQRAVQNLGLLIIDEAHRAGATTYRDLISTATAKFQTLQVVGLSATPVRDSYSAKAYRGTEQLTRLFEQLVEPSQSLSKKSSSVCQLQELGVLARLNVKRLGKRTVDMKSRIYEVAEIAKEPGRTGLLFAKSVAQAKLAAMYLRQFGISSDYVTGDSSSADRANLVSALKRGDLHVLSNCEILTTGFDAPRVTDIYMFRATQSLVLYKQMVGRGLRGKKFGGESSCDLHLCGVDLPFDPDPNTSQFARAAWSNLS